MTADDFSIVLPEVLLAVYAMAALMFGAFMGKDRTAPLLVWTTTAAFVLLALWILAAGPHTHVAFGGLFIDDGFARFGKVMILLAGAAVLLIGKDFLTRRDLLRFEYPVLIALATVGMMMMVSSGDLMALYVGLELHSLALYVLVSLRRDSARSTEAGLKYFILGSLSSGFLLYGASLAYGYAGTTLFSGILSTVVAGSMPIGLLFALVFIIAGLTFKVSAVPFHMWTPDVYEGAPTPVTVFLATAPKVAAMCLLARLVHDAFGSAPADYGQILAALSVASMFLGAVAGIGQRDFKRLMAYSTISHMGFALMGLAVGTAEGVEATLIYLAIYVTMDIGAFSFILSMQKDGRPVTDIDSLRLYSKREPLKALALLVVMFSLAGVPPTVGFIGKLSVLRAAVDGGMAWLAVAGVITSVIGAFYYLRIVYYMYFGEDRDALDVGVMSRMQWVFLIGSALVMTLGIVNLLGVEGLAQAAAAALVH